MAQSELCYLSIHEASARIESRQLSPVELTRAFLERIEQLDGTLQAYITVLAEPALTAARAAEAEILRGDYRGPLHGIPIALKDLYDTKGVRTTASSRVMAERVPAEDATTTARLAAAGSILLGKLAMHEFALGGPDPTCGFPLARNPWNLDYIPGGSSSGSGATVAAGLCMGALGSCTGGSIRGPAAYCSIVGLKATYGRVSRYGVVPLSWTLDHCGPMTWTVEDTAHMLQAIAGYDPKDPTSSRAPVPDYAAALREDVKGLTIGVPRDFFFADDPRIDREILQGVETALGVFEAMGARVEDVTIPMLHYAAAAQPVIMLSEAERPFPARGLAFAIEGEQLLHRLGRIARAEVAAFGLKAQLVQHRPSSLDETRGEAAHLAVLWVDEHIVEVTIDQLDTALHVVQGDPELRLLLRQRLLGLLALGDAASIDGFLRGGALFECIDLVDQLRLRFAKAALPKCGWIGHMPLLAKRLYLGGIFAEEDVTIPWRNEPIRAGFTVGWKKCP